MSICVNLDTNLIFNEIGKFFEFGGLTRSKIVKFV